MNRAPGCVRRRRRADDARRLDDARSLPARRPLRRPSDGARLPRRGGTRSRTVTIPDDLPSTGTGGVPPSKRGGPLRGRTDTGRWPHAGFSAENRSSQPLFSWDLRALAGKRDRRRRLLTRNLYPFRTREVRGHAQSRQQYMPICRYFIRKPSDGLEPSTPSLPWKSRGGNRVHVRSFGCTFVLQIGF
jgi:hypothetical protein